MEATRTKRRWLLGWTALLAVPLILGYGSSCDTTVGDDDDDSALVPMEQDANLLFDIAAPEIQEGDALVVECCAERAVGGAMSDWSLSVDETVTGDQIELQGTLHWLEDPDYADDDGTTDQTTTLSIHGLAEGTYTVSANGGVGDCWDHEDGATITVTVLPAS